MNQNRTHANTPSKLTAVDHARMRAAIAKHEAAKRKERNADRIKAAAAVALVIGLLYTFGPAIIAAGMGAANAFGG